MDRTKKAPFKLVPSSAEPKADCLKSRLARVLQFRKLALTPEERNALRIWDRKKAR